jgi:hypothetical protein
MRPGISVFLTVLVVSFACDSVQALPAHRITSDTAHDAVLVQYKSWRQSPEEAAEEAQRRRERNARLQREQQARIDANRRERDQQVAAGRAAFDARLPSSGSVLLLAFLPALVGLVYGFVAGSDRTTLSPGAGAICGAILGALSVIGVKAGWSGQWLELSTAWYKQTLDEMGVAAILLGLPFAFIMIVVTLGGAAVLFVAPLVAAGCALGFLPAFLRGCHYLFVPHAAEPIITPALRRGTSIDTAALADVIEPDMKHFHHPPPAYQSENQAARARALKDKIDADTELAEAALRRERAAAELKHAERRLAEAKRKASRGG